ncbi:MAG: methionyl-tRNA formyltransferase [Candidatus Scalindua sp.]|nr:methionyl-tRNA formyltransferase [Candidatus Scalindua sp.]
MNINMVDIMCPYKEVSTFNSDYFDLGEVAKDYSKSVYYFEKIKDEARHIEKKRPDIIFVFGLSQIIPISILKTPTIGCLGSHPALLPQNRGRHPIIWALANGLTKSGVTLFWLNEGVDSGDIWAQKAFDISVEDNASTIYNKVSNLSINLLNEKIPEIEKGIVTRIQQEHSKANYWRKRTSRDGEIDWRMSSKRINDLVRALTMPYIGAHCNFKGKEIIIWKAKIIDNCKGVENLESGKVIDVVGSKIIVKTGDGLIALTDHRFEYLPQVGDYL